MRVRWPLLPLTPIYAAGQALESLSYARGWRRVERLGWPVVSIGNLSVGGAGKTPFAIWLAQSLAERGWAADVLTRGYGRSSRAVERVDAGAREGGVRYGDEPWLIAQQTKLPVYVARRRAEAGRLADGAPGDARMKRRVHLLDDGMQHRELARDAEIVLLHRSDFATALLPAGRLREPLAALERADFIVLRAEDARLAERARRWMRRDAQLWTMRRMLEAPVLPGAALAFCAIAHPAEFEEGLRAKGEVVAASLAWRDHHRFTDGDIARLRERAASAGARCFVTTEKDLARLTQQQRERLEAVAPLIAARLSVELDEPEAALAALELRLLARVRESSVATQN